MGIVKDVVGGIFGSGADAAKDAANIQAQSADKAIAANKDAAAQAREDLTPFRDVGSTDLEGLAALVADPNAQRAFIEDNPFFDVLSEKATSTLLNNQAAKGKVGSGETAEALRNSLLLLGTDLLNQNITQRQNLATIGSNAAAGQATITQNSANALTDLITGKGDVQAAGVIGARNAQIGALNDARNFAAGIAL